jgi:Fe2+ transport system protein FeoA
MRSIARTTALWFPQKLGMVLAPWGRGSASIGFWSPKIARKRTVSQVIPLSLLGIGETAEVLAVEGRPDQARRLGEMGFREGASVEMLQPGSTCIVRLDASRICFRDSETSSVLVRPRVTA